MSSAHSYVLFLKLFPLLDYPFRHHPSPASIHQGPVQSQIYSSPYHSSPYSTTNQRNPLFLNGIVYNSHNRYHTPLCIVVICIWISSLPDHYLNDVFVTILWLLTMVASSSSFKRKGNFIMRIQECLMETLRRTHVSQEQRFGSLSTWFRISALATYQICDIMITHNIHSVAQFSHL